MAVRVTDILFRAGGATLRRLQTLVSAGAGRTEVAHTFARATVKRAFRDRDGIAKRAAAGFMGLDWPSGLVDAGGNAIGGPLSEGARTQLVTDPENFGAWTAGGTPIITSGQADPFGGTAAYQIEDDAVGGLEGVSQAVTFTGNGTKAIACYFKGGTASEMGIGLFSGAVWRHRISIAWSGGVPTPSSAEGAGILYPAEAVSTAPGWYRVLFAVNNVVAADGNTIFIRTATLSTVGTWSQFGCNAWNSPFPSSYQGAGESAGVADALTSPINFGPQSDLTVLVRLGRPYHADAAGALGVSPGIFSFGAGSAPRIGAYFDPAARNIIGVIDTATTDQTVSAAIPAGNPTVSFQFKNLTTGGQVAIDTGSGLSAFSSAATAFSAFSSQTLRIGRYDDELYGVIGDLVVARGLFSRTEMMAVL